MYFIAIQMGVEYGFESYSEEEEEEEEVKVTIIVDRSLARPGAEGAECLNRGKGFVSLL